MSARDPILWLMMVAVLACDTPAAGSRRVAAEAAADSLAWATIPPGLAPSLGIGPYLSDGYLAAASGSGCVVQSEAGASEERRRVRLRLPDSALAIVYVRSVSDSAPQRVELLRRAPDGEQVGIVWQASGDTVSVVRWPEGLARPAERTLHPRGGPLPRVMRSLARRVRALDCQPGVRPR